jgi:hypothetical protein
MVAGRDIWWHDVIAGQSDVCEPEWVDAEHPLFLLYTSGSTGKPKGVQHSTGGYLLHAILTMKWTFDLKPDDVFWCTADIGWVTGHTYITYGPLACGGDRDGFRRRADLPGRRPFLEDDPGPQGQHLLHRADRHPLADQGRPIPIRRCIRRTTTCRRCACWVRSASRSTRLPGSGTTTTSAAPLPDRRYLLADRDRRPHDHPAAGRDADGSGFLHAALPGHPGGCRR